MERNEEKYEVRYRLHASTAELNYCLECFGNKLATDLGYKGVDGMDAIWLYLIKTYQWTPTYVKAMNPEDIHMVLSQEYCGAGCYHSPSGSGVL
jgi:hypothetical protein